jgi:hypothetical protein
MRLALADPGYRKCVTALVIIGVVVLITGNPFAVPFTVGYAAARRLVEQEDEEAALRKQAAEYRAAAEFYRTPEGQEAAARLALNMPAPGERRAILMPEPAPPPPHPGLRDRVSNFEKRVTDALHFQMRVLRRWVHDPPQETVPLPNNKGGQPPKTPAPAH